MTWITADERILPPMESIVKKYGLNSRELHQSALDTVNMGLFTSGHGFLTQSKGLTNPFEKLASSLVGQWIKWEGWRTDSYDTIKIMPQDMKWRTGSKDPEMNIPENGHYKLTKGLGNLALDKDWTSFFPWSQHQFRPQQGSIGKIMQVMLSPSMVTQSLRSGQYKNHLKGFNVRGLSDDYLQYDLTIVANVEWYRVPENDKRLKSPKPYRRKMWGITDEPEKTIYGNVAWCGSWQYSHDSGWNPAEHPAHAVIFDGFRVWNDSKNNLYIGDMGFSLSTPMKQTQIINHVWKPTK